ncbi:ribose transport system permease protein [Caminicella sporogenes DSM 14501]|uniref:Ribose transport system permease protein n=1 Tax=Caminicella sporogenes DSM 14501 TaxID=1121266 RepID=A0A1M6PG20_9FIRM|nr:ribose ABC transporter permease [Caminicella sporogenes]RKD21412.1 ribose ABC transporter permease [Caminicella sporogenes]SHK06893.1 ribose transport system permease protein [Caminicella sporogenes DSM 14501]
MNMNLSKVMKYKSIIGLVLFSIIISILNPRFLTVGNILNILRQTSINSIIAAGMTFVILTGGIDLSVGSILALTGAYAASMVSAGLNPFLAVIITLVIGAVIGILNGVIISKGKVQPFIATLAIMTFARGATLVFTNGKPISIGYEKNAEIFSKLGSGYFLQIPIPIYIMILVFALGYYILKYTRLGRYIYALGGNEEATKLSGISTDNIKLYVYGISGLLSALAGIIITARLSSAQPTAGTGYELDAIAAVVLGGTSLAGGVGSILGTIIGALIIGILNNALNLMDVSSYYQFLAKGLVILVAVLLDRKQK